MKISKNTTLFIYKLRKLNFINTKNFLKFLLITFLLNSSLISKAFSETNNSKIGSSNFKEIFKDKYLLGPGDKLFIRVFDAPELDTELKIINDGTVEVPYIGSFEISGKTIDEARLSLKEKLSEILIDPEIQLKLISQRPAKISVLGEVSRPGIYSLSMDYKEKNSKINNNLTNNFPTVINALQEAGGINSYGNLENIVLIRKFKDEDISYKKANLNFIKLIQEGDQTQNPFIFDGDIIKVNKVDSSSEKYSNLSRSNFSPDKINLFVIGEVKNPGQIEMNSNTPLVQAILAAGGPTNWRANKGNIQLIRINRNGTATAKKYRINLNQGVSEDNNPLLKDGDTILVQRNRLAFGSDIVDSIATPASKIVNIYSLVKILNLD